jgi:hypothetical protein
MSIQNRSIMQVCFLAASLVLNSCFKIPEDPNVIKGKGKIIVNSWESLSAFESVTSKISAYINIYHSTQYSMNVAMQENLFEHLIVSTSGENLVISFGNKAITTDEPITINVYMPSLSKFVLYGACELDSKLPVEEVNLVGAGILKFRGAGDNVVVNIPGQGTVDLYDMPVKTATVNISGNGNVKVKVENALNIYITGLGMVHYKGNPTVKQSITGMGEVINDN